MNYDNRILEMQKKAYSRKIKDQYSQNYKRYNTSSAGIIMYLLLILMLLRLLVG